MIIFESESQMMCKNLYEFICCPEKDKNVIYYSFEAKDWIRFMNGSYIPDSMPMLFESQPVLESRQIVSNSFNAEMASHLNLFQYFESFNRCLYYRPEWTQLLY